MQSNNYGILPNQRLWSITIHMWLLRQFGHWGNLRRNRSAWFHWLALINDSMIKGFGVCWSQGPKYNHMGDDILRIHGLCAEYGNSGWETLHSIVREEVVIRPAWCQLHLMGIHVINRGLCILATPSSRASYSSPGNSSPNTRKYV